MKLQPAVAGQFYPGTRKELQAALKSFEKEEAPRLEGAPLALLLPHAGYMYSGAVAALGYRALEDPVETVIVAGPSHYVPFRGVSIFAGESAVTPLGEVPVDQDAVQFLMDFDPHIADIPPAFAREHSVEVHLPMIQTYLPKAKVVPLVMGQGVEQAVKPLTRALLALLKKKRFLFIASSDLSHYPDYETAVKADHELLEALLTGDEKKVNLTDGKIMGRGYAHYHCTHCGREPVSALLRFTHEMKADKIKLLSYRNSGDVTGDHSRVVGYSSMAFCR
jgi:AmmeMemoRadiSam system protein B